MRGTTKSKPLPCSTCKGRCCRYAPIELAAWNKVKHLVGPDAELLHRWEGEPKDAWFAFKPGSDGICYFLTEEGKCSIYSRRPRSCRALGTRIPCPAVDPEGADEMVRIALASNHEFTDPQLKGNHGKPVQQGIPETRT